nr:hypothetical protein [Tanacetum cinerariifolium]
HYQNNRGKTEQDTNRNGRSQPAVAGHVRPNGVGHRRLAAQGWDADGHVALGVFGFLRGRAHGIKSNKGEEHNARAADDAAPAMLEETFVGAYCYAGRVFHYSIGRNEVRRVVGGVDKLPAHSNENHHNEGLEHHNNSIEQSRFLGAFHQQQAQHHDDEQGGQVDEAVLRYAVYHCRLEGRVAELIGYTRPKDFQELIQVFAPGNGYG